VSPRAGLDISETTHIPDDYEYAEFFTLFSQEASASWFAYEVKRRLCASRAIMYLLEWLNKMSVSWSQGCALSNNAVKLATGLPSVNVFFNSEI
jgi:hypothetical protein